MCNRIMCKGKGKSATVYLAAAVILTCYLAQTVDCNRSKKPEWRKEADAARRIGFKEGKIVFGRVFEEGSGLGSQVIDRTNNSSSNASVEEDAAYQADFAGWVEEGTQNVGSREAAWKRMSPSLQCGWDQLKFRAVGPGASQFAVEQSNAPPIHLSQVPSTCGYSMRRNSLWLVMLVPYDGCNMVQEVGSYVLPMRWQGNPFSLWCPKPPVPHHFYPPQGLPHFFPPYAFNPQYPTLEPETTTAPPLALPGRHNVHFPRYPFDPRYPFNPQYPTPEPEMTPPPALPGRHHVHFPRYPFNPQYPTLEPETTTTPPALPGRHHVHFPQYPFNPQYPTLEPEMMPPPALPGRHHVHFPRYPFDPRYPFNPQYPTLEPETTPPALPGRHHVHFPRYPLDPRYPFNPQYPILEPETTTPPPALPGRHHVHFPRYPFDPRYPFNPQYPTPEPETMETPTTEETDCRHQIQKSNYDRIFKQH
ncbi:leucine-rich repeat extensin-like protein 5 [Sander lucioperca]|uniref:leucine-rich repeat extensin-like protein 5 n=1 Tax=Sander lucioperca TaxID=283035 RepID=UPI001653C110|nr:leucine-rich repeat extensin-like protein 5 [Sander lucioperca]